MKKVFKWIGIVLGSLIGLLLLAGIVLFVIGNGRLHQVYNFHPRTLPFPQMRQALRMASIVQKHCARAVMAKT